MGFEEEVAEDEAPASFEEVAEDEALSSSQTTRTKPRADNHRRQSASQLRISDRLLDLARIGLGDLARRTFLRDGAPS